MTYLPPLNGGRINVTIGSNTAGAGALVSSGTMVLAGGNNITLSQNAGNAITFHGAAGGLSNINVSGSNSSSNLSAINFSNSNGVSFGLTTGSIITASHNGITSQTNQTIGFTGATNTTMTSTGTFDARSLRINGLGAASVGFSNSSLLISAPVQTAQTQSNIQAVYDGANSISTGTIRYSNANGVSFGINGQTLTASHNGITSQTNQTLGMFVTGNTTQNSSTVLDARSLTFNGLGGVSVGYSNGSVQISGAAGGGGGGGVALYDGVNSITSGTAQMSGGGALTVSANGQTLSFNAPAVSSLSATGAVSISTNGSTISVGVPNFSLSAGTTSNTLNNVVFSNSNGVSFGLNGSTVTASVAAGGGGGYTMASYEPWPIQNTGVAVLSANTNTSGAVSLIPFQVHQNAAAAYVNVVQSMSFVTGGTSSFNQSATINAGIYARGTGTNNTTLSLVTSMSYSYAASYNNSSITFSHPTSTNTAGYTYSSTASAGLGVSGGYSGFKLVQIPLNTILSPDVYFLGLMDRASSSSFNSGIRHSYYGNAMTLTGLAPIGSSSAVFTAGTNIPLGIGGNWQLGQGSFTSAGQTNLPNTLALSAVTVNISVIPYMKFVASA